MSPARHCLFMARHARRNALVWTLTWGLTGVGLGAKELGLLFPETLSAKSDSYGVGMISIISPGERP